MGGARLRPAKIHGCRIAGPGFIRRSGSQVRHLLMKSINSSSLHLSTWASVFEFGRRRLPLAFTNGRGAPVASTRQYRPIWFDAKRTKEQFPPGGPIDDTMIR
jgi:hypothetical protein